MDREKASALWMTQVGHMTLKMKNTSPEKKRYLFCDNFYTRHKFGNAINKLSDGDIKITGTIRFNFIEPINK